MVIPTVTGRQEIVPPNEATSCVQFRSAGRLIYPAVQYPVRKHRQMTEATVTD